MSSAELRVKAKRPWKKVKLDDELLARGVDKDFFGIEELTDYTLFKKSRTGTPVRKQVKVLKKKKRKKVAGLQGAWEVEGEEAEAEFAEVAEVEDQTAETTPVPNENEEDAAEEGSQEFVVTPEMTIWKAMFLPDSMVRAVWEMGFENPTAIQLAVLPTAMKGRKDVVGAAETGSGKTLAFGIPIISGILKDKDFERKKAAKLEKQAEDEQDSEPEETPEQPTADNHDPDHGGESESEGQDANGDDHEPSPEEGGQVIDLQAPSPTPSPTTKLRALIVTPTRELAVQIEKHLKAVAKYTGVTMALVIGGMAAPKQERLLSKGPDIVIGTPGRLWELIEGGNPHLSQVTDIRYLALDETDRLLERGHFGELRTLLEHMNRDDSRSRWRQNFVFSATLTLDHELPDRLNSKLSVKKKKKKQAMKLDSLLKLVGVRPKAKMVDLTSADGGKGHSFKPATLTEMKLCSATLEDKDYYLYYFLRHHAGRTLVFCNSINNVRRITSVFTLLNMKPLPLHAQLHQKQRLKHLERFTAADNALLIATDVAARGLDIPNVQNVVHYQVPRTSENYVHRSGRTARARRDGLSLMLVEPSETSLYRRLCKTLHKQKDDLPDYDIDMKVLAAVKQRVNLARSIEILEHRTKRDRSDQGWAKKMAEEADMIVEDDDADQEDDANFTRAKLDNDLRIKKKELDRLLLRPLKRSIN